MGFGAILWTKAGIASSKGNNLGLLLTGYLKRVIVTPVVSAGGSEPSPGPFNPSAPGGRRGEGHADRLGAEPGLGNGGSNYDSLELAGEEKKNKVFFAIAAFGHKAAPNPRGTMRPGGRNRASGLSPLQPLGDGGKKGTRKARIRIRASFLRDLAPSCGRRLRSQA